MAARTYSLVRARLSEWLRETVASLPTVPDRDRLVEQKKEIEEAIRCLDLCARVGLDGTAQVHVLPFLEGRGGYSEFRVVDDAETENRALWLEPEIGGEKRRLTPGDLLVEKAPQRRARRPGKGAT